jgi:hypothetical protein
MIYVTFDVLERALRALGLQDQISAATLYHALEIELGGRVTDLPTVRILHSSPTSIQPPPHSVIDDDPKDELVTRNPTGPDLVHRYSKAQIHRSQEAGKEYARWLNAHPSFRNRSRRANNVDVATEQKHQSQ